MRAGIATALDCTLQRTMIDILAALLASYPPTLAPTGRYRRWRQMRLLLLRKKLRRVRTLLEHALVDARSVAAVGQVGDPFGSMEHVRKAAEAYLLGKLKRAHGPACPRLLRQLRQFARSSPRSHGASPRAQCADV